ncbi:MAG TPA: CBS domain-containing protein [Sumerlaeia bacterium]|nr:CBS domain-containing protein [Sumerlaeia bacterium]
MAENIRAKDLMRLSFLRLGAGHTLREALSILLDPQTREDGCRVLIVLNPDAGFAGILTTRYLLRALVPDWVREETDFEDNLAFEKRLLDSMEEKLEMKVAEAMNRDVPTATPGDRLPRLIECMQDKRLDCLPVVEQGRVVGVIHLTDVFNAAARLALAAQTDDAPPGR